MEEEKDQMALRKTEMKEKGQSELIILEEKMKNMIRKKKICMKKTQLRNWIPKQKCANKNAQIGQTVVKSKHMQH